MWPLFCIHIVEPDKLHVVTANHNCRLFRNEYIRSSAIMSDYGSISIIYLTKSGTTHTIPCLNI